METKNPDVEKLARALEPMIRRIIREELDRAVQKYSETFELHPGTSLYEDMEEIAERSQRDALEFHWVRLYLVGTNFQYLF